MSAARRLLAVALAATALSPPATATPAPGSAERAAILDAVRVGTGTSGRVIVDHLRTDGAAAYVELHGASADGMTGKAFLTREGGRWTLAWAVAGGGATACAELSRLYDLAVRRAGDSALFSVSFEADRAEADAGAQRGEICLGDILAAPR